MWDLIVSVPDHCLSFYSSWKPLKMLVLHRFYLTDILQINDVVKETQYPVFEKGADMH